MAAGYCNENGEVFSRLHNGLSREQNRAFAESTDIDNLVRTIISQLKLLPLVRENVSRGRLFRILALDGGGLRGAFTAAVLAKWEAIFPLLLSPQPNLHTPRYITTIFLLFDIGKTGEYCLGFVRRQF